MTNRNPRRGGNTAGAAGQFEQQKHTASAAPFQSPSTLLDWALMYAARGLAVFPLKPRSKLPLIPAKAGGRGFYDATTDKNKIIEWWTACPDANIGMATGASGLVVLDPDGPEGIAQLEAVARQYGGWPLPRTLTSKTGRDGGLHLFYRGSGIKSSQIKGEHLDVRGDSGYVVLAPSVHPSGVVYAWVDAAQPIAPVPKWVALWVASRRGAAGPTPQVPESPPGMVKKSGRGLAAKSIANLTQGPPYSKSEANRLLSALSSIPSDIDGKTWSSFGAALHDLHWIAVDGSDQGLEIWDTWSKTSKGKGAGNGEYRGRADLEKRWRGFARDYDGPRTTIGSIYYLAKDRGWVENGSTNNSSESRSEERGSGGSGEQAGASATEDSRSGTGGPELNAGPSDGKGNDAPSWRESLISAADLRKMTFEPVRYVLDRFIPEGMTLLVGRPKVGKSWWVLDLCLACAAGHSAFETLKALQGDVLYLALEDGKRRLQRRLDKLLPTFSGEWPNELKLVPMGGWRRADQGGLEDIEAWCNSVPKPALVVVDTLERIRKPANGKSPLYSADYEAITGLQKIAIKYGIAIVVLHHDRKSDADDAFDTVSGTLGLTGAADTILIIKRRPNGVVLYARGRDIEESETAMQFDKATCRWNILGAASEVLRSNERARVIAALKLAGRPLSVREIMADSEMQNRNATDILLGKMARDGEIVRVGRGRYDLSTQEQRTDRTERKNA